MDDEVVSGSVDIFYVRVGVDTRHTVPKLLYPQKVFRTRRSGALVPLAPAAPLEWMDSNG